MTNDPYRLADAVDGVLPARFADVAPVPPALMRETDEDRQERQALSRLHRHNRYFRRLPKRYAGAMLGDLHPTHQDPDGKVSRWLASGHQTLLLASAEPGLGKTHAAYAVGSEAVNEGLVVEAYTAMELLAALRPNPREPMEPANVLDDVLTCDLLVLDDLGRENATPWAQEQVHHVLNARLGNALRSVVTTNLTSDEMGQRYGYPLVDRVLDDAVVVKVTGESRRRPAAW